MTNYEIYELIAEELEDRVDSGEITLEFAESVNDLAYNKYVTESTTPMSVLKESLSNYKKNMKEIKKLIKDGDISKAKKEINSAKSELKKSLKEVENIKSTEGSAVLSILKDFSQGLIFCTVFDTVNGNMQNRASVNDFNKEMAKMDLEGNLVAKDRIYLRPSSVALTALLTSINSVYNIYKKDDKESLVEALDSIKKDVKKVINICINKLDKLENSLK